MKALVTGSSGFIGKNLVVHLRERRVEPLCFDRGGGEAELARFACEADFVFHLAGVNRPKDPADFAAGNAELTRRLASLLEQAGRRTPIVFSSSLQAELDNPYGRSKRAAEEVLLQHGQRTGSPVLIYRLPNVFGKWCRPDYNSVVATFCHNIARDLPITVHDPAASLSLVYIDDVVAEFVRMLEQASQVTGPFRNIEPVYRTTVGGLADAIRTFKASRASLLTERVGSGLLRALYATYVSYLPPESFSYSIAKHTDPRGEFAEILKTLDCGQFSYFTAHPGMTRGGHYHHSKTEKFLVLRGRARFRFRHIVNGQTAELETSGDAPRIVETVPGWAHDITNIGDTEMVVILWANEVFDHDRPDTVAAKV